MKTKSYRINKLKYIIIVIIIRFYIKKFEARNKKLEL